VCGGRQKGASGGIYGVFFAFDTTPVGGGGGGGEGAVLVCTLCLCVVLCRTSGLAAFTFVRLYSGPFYTHIFNPFGTISRFLRVFIHVSLGRSSIGSFQALPYAATIHCSSCLLRHPVVFLPCGIACLGTGVYSGIASLISIASPASCPPARCWLVASSLQSTKWSLLDSVRFASQLCIHSGAGVLSVSARLSLPLGLPTDSPVWCVPFPQSCSLCLPAAAVCHALR